MKSQSLTVDELRAFGFDVHVQHHRVFNEIGQWESDGQGIDNVLTRGEYNRAQQSGQLDFTDDLVVPNRYYDQGYNLPEEIPYGKAVSPTGGFTTVNIITPNGVSLRGKFNFGKKEPFCRRQGVLIAINRAMYGSRVVNTESENVQTEMSVES